MKKLVLVLIISGISIGMVLGQDTAEQDTSWKKGGFFGLQFGQASLSHWAAGGSDNIALNSSLNLFANFEKNKTLWSNSLDLGYALVKTGRDPVQKSDDKIELNTKYSYKIGTGDWYYSALSNFKSQFSKGYLYPDDSNVVSKFLAPGYLTLSAGITWKPVEYFEVMLSPATGKYTFVNDQLLSDAGAYGVDSGKKVRTEFGAYLNALFKKDILPNVTLSSKLELFNNYTDKDSENKKRVDVNWENNLNMKVNKFITATATFQVVYDQNILPRTQYKQVIGVGFGYKF